VRFVGFRAVFDSEPDFELISPSLPDIGTQTLICCYWATALTRTCLIGELENELPTLAHCRKPTLPWTK
jgi:hypothetical protein